MMKLVLLAVLSSVAFAAERAVTPGQLIKILHLESKVDPDGKYNYVYETENGIAADESGEPAGTGEDAGTAAQGKFSYTSPEGLPVSITYVANQDGFQPVGNVIPTPPPLPDAIVKALAYNEQHPGEEANEKLSGQYDVPETVVQFKSVPVKYSPVGAYSLG